MKKNIMSLASVALIALPLSIHAQSPLAGLTNIIAGIPTVPLAQANVVVDIGTVSQDVLWNNIRGDYFVTTNFFLGAEVRNNLTTIGGLFGDFGYAVNYSTVQFAPTVSAGYNLYHKRAEVDALPIYLRYTPQGSAVSLFAGAGYWFSPGAKPSLYPSSGPHVVAGLTFPF
jgi:hypothetical protein